MDYEKKYKEALNWMKDVYPTIEGAAKEDAEHYFPELKETWNEKVRKWIIEMVEEVRKANPTNAEHNGMCSEAIFWLEKQGEQKTAWSEEDEEMIEGLVNCLDELEKENGWNYVYVVGKSVELNKVREWLKSLKERYTWSPREEQLETLENVRKILHSNEEIYSKINHFMFNFEELIRTLKKLREE